MSTEQKHTPEEILYANAELYATVIKDGVTYPRNKDRYEAFIAGGKLALKTKLLAWEQMQEANAALLSHNQELGALLEEKTLSGINLDALNANTEKLKRVEKERDTYSKLIHEKNDKIRELEAQVKRLREALEKIVDLSLFELQRYKIDSDIRYTETQEELSALKEDNKRLQSQVEALREALKGATKMITTHNELQADFWAADGDFRYEINQWIRKHNIKMKECIYDLKNALTQTEPKP